MNLTKTVMKDNTKNTAKGIALLSLLLSPLPSSKIRDPFIYIILQRYAQIPVVSSIQAVT